MDTIYAILETFYDVGVPIGLFAALYGMRWRERFWGNIITVFVVFFSTLIAVNWFEPLAHWVTGQSAGTLFIADYLFIWLLFIVSFCILNEITRVLSRVNVKFPVPVENAGNFIMITILLCMIWSFYTFSLNVAPLGETGGVELVGGDSTQIKIFRQLSSGNLSTFGNKHIFDEYGEFRQDHLLRRKALLQYRLKSDEFPFFYDGEIPPMKGIPKEQATVTVDDNNPTPDNPTPNNNNNGDGTSNP
ncbi:MAG: hypothetical protein LBE18_01690 [Planctomycetaceae bacterium]|jgi:hypothetical protein|nr:hypothetical protein [Planctomycetaceae bacterium]